MCDISLDHCEVWSETPRVARKEHRCSSCRGKIQPKERYVVHFSIHEGSQTSEKLCTPCEKARHDFAAEHDAMLCTPSYLPEMLADCIADGDEESEKLWKPMLEALRARAA